MRNRSHRARGVIDQFFEVERLIAHDQVPRVRAREQKQIVHDARETARGILHHRNRRAILRFIAMLARERNVGFRTHDRRWRSQFVRGVGDEAALLLERRFESVEQTVHHRRQTNQLVATTHRQPLVHVPHADRARLRGHRRNRREAASGQCISAERRRDQQQRNCDQKHFANAREHFVDIAQRIHARQREVQSICLERLRQNAKVSACTRQRERDRASVTARANGRQQLVLHVLRRTTCCIRVLILLGQRIHCDESSGAVENRDMQFTKSHFLDGGPHRIDDRHRGAPFGDELAREGSQRIADEHVRSTFERTRDHHEADDGEERERDAKEDRVPEREPRSQRRRPLCHRVSRREARRACVAVERSPCERWRACSWAAPAT